MAEILNRCPVCKGKPTIGIEANSNKPIVACMNICCSNMQRFTDDSVGKAMAEWNKWAYLNGAEDVNRCVACGEIIPEGRITCPMCDGGIKG